MLCREAFRKQFHGAVSNNSTDIKPHMPLTPYATKFSEQHMPSTESNEQNTKGKIWNRKGPVVFSPLFDWPLIVDSNCLLLKCLVQLDQNIRA